MFFDRRLALAAITPFVFIFSIDLSLAQSLREPTIVRSLAGGNARDFPFPTKILLPKNIVAQIGQDGSLPVIAGTRLIIDTKYGEFYRFARETDGIVRSIEAVRDIGRSNEVCDRIASRGAILGTSEPRERAGSSAESDAPFRLFTFEIGCTKYIIKVQCADASRGTPCSRELQRLQTLRDWRQEVGLARLVRVDEFSGAAMRPSPSAASGAAGNLPPKDEFSYVEPGVLHVRQYIEPKSCTDNRARASGFYVDARTEFSRLVFAGPNVMTRFPVDLATVGKAVPNSQSFSPGGYSLLKLENEARLRGQGFAKGANFATNPGAIEKKWKKENCESTIAYEKTAAGALMLGSPGERNSYALPLNFKHRWADTFCEFRGRPGTNYFFCGRGGRTAEGIHYGVDIRGAAQDPDTHTPVVAVADGVIVELNPPSDRLKNEGACRANPESQFCDHGHTVKLKPFSDPRITFVYRHMHPEWSPFSPLTGRSLKVGDKVSAGQLIGYMHGYMDNILLGTSKHLHFEIEFSPPRSLLNRCTRRINGTVVQLCDSGSPKVPPYASLLVAYLREQYRYSVKLDATDPELGVFKLPELPNEITLTSLKASGAPIDKLAPFRDE